jgi:hypothetical protein
MRRIGVVLALLAVAVALPAASLAKPRSFHSWAVSWNAKATRDNARVLDRCQRLHGRSDLEFGMCFVDAGRANLRAERVVWEKQVAAVARGQAGPCKSAIRTYFMASRVKQDASLTYLDSHRRTPLTRIAGDIAGEPYATLRSLADKARARASAICG